MPETRIAPHVHLETDCHCPTITRPTEAERLQAELDRLRAALIYRPVSGADAEVCRGCWLVGFNGVDIAHAPTCWVAPLLA